MQPSKQYIAGFMVKCAEYGINAPALVKQARESNSQTWEKPASTRAVREAAKLLRKSHPSFHRKAERILARAIPVGKTRSIGPVLGRGYEGAVFPSYTGGKGFTVTKVLPKNYSEKLEHDSLGLHKAPDIRTKAEILASNPAIFPAIHQIHPRGWVMERLLPFTSPENRTPTILKSLRARVGLTHGADPRLKVDPFIQHKGKWYQMWDYRPAGSDKGRTIWDNVMQDMRGRLKIADPAFIGMKSAPVNLDASAWLPEPRVKPKTEDSGLPPRLQNIVSSIFG